MVKARGIIAILLVICTLLCFGCQKEEETKPVYQSKNFTFTEEMVVYMAAYTKMMLKEEMLAAGADTTEPLSEQEKSDGESWEDYICTKTAESIEEVLLLCEAALLDGYTASEGMVYKADEQVTYLSNIAEEAGLTAEEYVHEIYGDAVTLDALKICTQMMALSEGYELDFMQNIAVSDDEASAFADNYPQRFLKFNALRYTTDDKSIADRLAAADSREEYLGIISSVSGLDMTDADKNGAPDCVEVKDAVVDSDPAGEFATEEGRAKGDTTVSEEDGKYTVTMLLTLPARKAELLWDYRMVYLSSESSSDPELDATSLLDQWKEKQGGEEGFSNLAARYSDHTTAYYGGLVSDQTIADMPNEAVAAWVCDTARVPGDTTVIPDGDSGAYMLYFIKGYSPKWINEAVSAIRSDKFDENIDTVKADAEKDMVLDEELLRKAVKSAFETK